MSTFGKLSIMYVVTLNFVVSIILYKYFANEHKLSLLLFCRVQLSLCKYSIKIRLIERSGDFFSLPGVRILSKGYPDTVLLRKY